MSKKLEKLERRHWPFSELAEIADKQNEIIDYLQEKEIKEFNVGKAIDDACFDTPVEEKGSKLETTEVKKELILTKLQRERAIKISEIFNCYYFEPDVCSICTMIEVMVSQTRRE